MERLTDKRLKQLVQYASKMAARFADGVLISAVDAPIMVEMRQALCELQQHRQRQGPKGRDA